MLRSVTRSDWEAAHTGGACFWLATPPYVDDERKHAHLVVTAWPDVLSGADTVSDVEAGGGWLLTAFPGGHGGDEADLDSRTWPDDFSESGLGTEELPIAVVEAVNWLAERGVQLHT